MWKQFKRYAQLFFSLLLCAAILLISYGMLQETSLDLSTAARATGVVTSAGKAKGHFVFQLANQPYRFQVYQVSRNYDLLRARLVVGDSVTVFYNARAATHPGAALQVYQVEHRGQVIVDKALLGGQNRNGGIIGLLSTIGLVGIAIWQFRRQAPFSQRKKRRVG
ncbi:hypothetical protein LJY25_01815 [Hymenobacter sp. BT175]|uniref:hypothetical protein n=1 Tax=Hymenobacter translucens TaxID=2886507 RepID=UPI001D0F1ED0|nr:hypothetical protein [Hymenobacter translucens]MCC2545168.1 hypothetical protein [Hymenobacter translucens]